MIPMFDSVFILTGKFILGIIIAWFVGGHLGLSIIYSLMQRYDAATIPKMFDVGSNTLLRVIPVNPDVQRCIWGSVQPHKGE